MRIIGVIMVVAALALGIIAVIFLRNFLEEQETERASQRAVVPIKKVVVARNVLDFGDVLAETAMREVDWPQDALPQGVFSSTKEILGDGERRVVLRRIEVNEPILKTKISGFGGRAALSTIMPKMARAVTIRVNDIAGVAGFVLPGDHVDIMLTRSVAGSRVTDILMQNVKVLAVDQLTGTTAEKPVVAKAITFEVSPEQAQKLILARQVGSLTLTLRNEANMETVDLPSLSTQQLLEREAPPVVVEKAAPKPEPITESPASIAAKEAAEEAKAAAAAALETLEQAKSETERAIAKAEAVRARAAAEAAARRAESEAKAMATRRLEEAKSANDKDLSNKLRGQMRALTIRVNDIVGVAGFVLPGDHVDIILIMSGEGGAAKSKASYLMQNVRVLAVDQRAAEDVSEPRVAKAVTLAVMPVDAQKLALAAHVGKLVLTLRGTENALLLALSTISIEQILGRARPAPIVVAAAPTRVTGVRRRGPRRLPRLVNVNIIRALKKSKQKVLREASVKVNMGK